MATTTIPAEEGGPSSIRLPFPQLRYVSFEFACENHLSDSVQIVGTGGIILKGIMVSEIVI